MHVHGPNNVDGRAVKTDQGLVFISLCSIYEETKTSDNAEINEGNRHEGCTITFFPCSAGILLINSGGIYLPLSAWFNISFMSPTRIAAFWSIMLCRISFRGDGAPSDILRQILKPSNCGIVAWVRLFPRDRSTVIQKNKYWLTWKKAKLSVNINLQPSRVRPMQKNLRQSSILDSRYRFLIFCQWSLDSRFQSLTGLTATRKVGFAKLGESNVGLGK